MATDFFGTNRTIGNTNEIASSEFATISVGGVCNLCQSVSWEYGRQINPVYEIGNPVVYFVSGHAQGSIQVGRLVGKKGFFSNWKSSGCGVITPITIDLTSGNCTGGSGHISFDGGMIQRLGGSINANTIEINETISVLVASMHV